MRNTLKMFTAVFITAAIALWFERIEFVWYPLMAVVIVVDDNDDQQGIRLSHWSECPMAAL
ncbi:hypothetical protein [Synechococcus sp. W4D4]|uniref:hypothetical protein n=1 Tax=Synechococcus sp. W4D4 TaxID=3392294 RepID=UPI0039E9E42B